MQTEREPFEWLLLYVQWVAVNTLAWVAGWGFARVAVELTYSLELGAVVLLVAGSGLMLVGTRLLTNGVLYREGEPRDPIKVGGWAKLFFNIYTFLTGGLLAALIFGTFDLLKNDFYIEHFLLLAPVYIFGREIIVAKMDEKKMDGIWIIVIIGGILFLALTGNVIREVVETWQLSVKFVHSILLPGVENALWPAVFGLIMGVLPGLPLVGFLQRIPLDLVEINRKDREDLAKKKKGRKYELFYILIFVGMLASSAMQPCGWMKEIVSPSDCLNKFEVGGADIIAFSPDGKLLATGSGEIQGGKNGVSFWLLPYGALVAEFETTASYARSLEFSPDGSLLAVSGEYWIEEPEPERIDEVKVWSVGDGSLQYAVDGGNRLAFSQDGKRLVTYSADQVWVRNALTGEILHSWEIDEELSITKLAVSFHGDQIALGFKDGLVQIWDVEQAKLTKSYEYPGKIQSLVFAKGDAVWAVIEKPSQQWDIWLYKGLTEQRVVLSKGFFLGNQPSQFSQDQKIIWFSYESNLTVVASENGEQLYTITDLARDRSGRIDHSMVSPDNRGIAIRIGRTIQYWQIPPLTLAD